MKERGIADRLSGLRKVDLEDIGNLLGHDLSSHLKKQEMVRDLTGYLTKHPRRWLSHLLEQDIRLLKELVRSGPGRVRYMDRSEYFSLPEMMGIVEYDDSDTEHRKIWVDREVYDLVAPNIDRVIQSGEKSGRFAIEKVGLGYLNLYGVLSTEQFIELMMDYHESAFGTGHTDHLVRILRKSPLLKLCRYVDEMGDYLVSPCVENPEDIFRLREEAGIAEDVLRPYRDEDALEAGAGGPYYSYGFKTPEGRKLEELLKKIGFEGFDLVRVQHDLWISSQLPFSDDALFDPLVERGSSIGSDLLYRQCVEAIVDYANIVPKWALAGYTALEKDYLVLEYPLPEDDEPMPDGMEEAVPRWSMPHPTISDGYTDLIETDEKLESVSSLLPDGFPFGLAIPHVAPNDPCPCGSGLRYAHCHGKFFS